MPSENTKNFIQNQKSDKASFTIYADLESLTEKIDGCKIDPEKSSATKVDESIPPTFSMSRTFKSLENRHDIYGGKDWFKNFCESLRELAMEIINFKKKSMKSLTNEQQKS